MELDFSELDSILAKFEMTIYKYSYCVCYACSRCRLRYHLEGGCLSSIGLCIIVCIFLLLITVLIINISWDMGFFCVIYFCVCDFIGRQIRIFIPNK